jgi:hypothetical protein
MSGARAGEGPALRQPRAALGRIAHLRPRACPACPATRRDEATFELSLFAESFHEALLRDAGAAILEELHRQRCV